MFKVIEHTLSGALVTAGTITPAYPDGYTEGDFQFGRGHKIVNNNGAVYSSPEDFTITLGDASFTVTWKNAASLAAGSLLYIQLEIAGDVDEGGHIVTLPSGVDKRWTTGSSTFLGMCSRP